MSGNRRPQLQAQEDRQFSYVMVTGEVLVRRFEVRESL